VLQFIIYSLKQVSEKCRAIHAIFAHRVNAARKTSAAREYMRGAHSGELKMEDRWLPVDETGGYLGVTRDTIYKWISEKKYARS
jgi:hypothetical protein